MEFISAEEFLKQSKEVQKVFLEWYKPEIHDIVCFTDDTTIEFSITDIGTGENYGLIYAGEIIGEEAIPLFTEGQLRRFIEEKLGKRINIKDTEEGYLVYLSNGILSNLDNLKNDLLQAYWQVAIQIAEEEVKVNE